MASKHRRELSTGGPAMSPRVRQRAAATGGLALVCLTGSIAALLTTAPRAATAALLGIAVLGCVMAITGASFALCHSDGPSTAGASGPGGPTPTTVAIKEIPPARLKLYEAAGRRFDIDWTFLASIGAQE